MREIDPERGYGPGLTDALRRLREGRTGAATELRPDFPTVCATRTSPPKPR